MTQHSFTCFRFIVYWHTNTWICSLLGQSTQLGNEARENRSSPNGPGEISIIDVTVIGQRDYLLLFLLAFLLDKLIDLPLNYHGLLSQLLILK